MKLINITISAILVLTAIPSGTVYAESPDNPEFDVFLEETAQNILEDDYLTMHFTVKKADNSVEAAPVFVPITENDFDEMKEEAEGVIRKLEEFDYNTLSDRQKADYNAVMDAYADQRDRESDPDFTWFFTPSSNLITNLATYLTEFSFYDQNDFENYISLLSSVPAYIESAVEITKDQASRGYFMSDTALAESLDQIEEFISEEDNNSIITAFNTRINESDHLGPEDKNIYIGQVHDIVVNSIIPACKNAVDDLSALRGTGSQQGYSGLEGGTEYFEKLTQYYSSTDKTIEEQFNDLDEFVKKSLKSLSKKMITGFEPEDLPASSPEETLSFLSSSMSQYGFPEISDISFTLEYVDDSSVAGNIVAYYVSSPTDDFKNNEIVINSDAESNSTGLYQTLAHEGFPGHMYQHVYYMKENPLLIRSLISFPGYSEGWAMYADYEANYWGKVSEESADYLASERAVNYAISAQIDLCVNGFGYTVEELENYLEQLGIDGSMAKEYYDAALCYAGNYGSYGYGLIRILGMKQNAEYSLGDNFSDTEFNQIILDDGPRNLEDVESDVIAWVESYDVKYKAKTSNDQLPVLLLTAAGVLTGGIIAAFVNRKKSD